MARPPFHPTDEQRQKVRMFAGLGIPQQDIAKALQVAPHTLRKHFRHELDCGSIEANAHVANALFKMAKSGKHPAATIFWMKTRCGWRERPSSDTVDIAPPEFRVEIKEAA